MEIILIALLLGILVIAGAYLMVEHDSEMEQKVYTGRIMATVESMSHCEMADIGEGAHEYVCELNVVYQIAGDTYRAKVMYSGTRTYNVGQAIELKVNPDDLTDVRVR